MPYVLCFIGAALLAFCVYLISGVGIAFLAFAGLLLIITGIYWWFLQTRNNALKILGIQNDQHYELTRIINTIQRNTR